MARACDGVEVICFSERMAKRNVTSNHVILHHFLAVIG